MHAHTQAQLLPEPNPLCARCRPRHAHLQHIVIVVGENFVPHKDDFNVCGEVCDVARVDAVGLFCFLLLAAGVRFL